MAKPNGLITFIGTINGISSYHSKHGLVMRKAGGPDPKKIKKDPAFKRSRENAKEFGNATKALGLLRRALILSVKEVADMNFTSRLTKVFMVIKTLDSGSKRGNRSVSKGLKTEAGKKLLMDFPFNPSAKIDEILKKSYQVKTPDGEIVIKAFEPRKDLKVQPAATHVRFKCILLRIDFEKKEFEIQESQPKMLAIKTAASTIKLKPSALSLAKGHTLSLLQICFYQVINGKEYPLKNANYNCMQVLGIW